MEHTLANPSKSLSCQIRWTSLLPVLSVELPQVTVLPQTISCPLCNGDQLTLLDDHVLGGTWSNCRACNFAGDLVELAAAVWEIEVPAAISKLDGLGQFSDLITDDDVVAYMRDHVNYRKRLSTFWDAARLAPMQHATPSVRLLLRKFGLLDASNSPTWPERAGRFIGSSTSKAVEELFSPLSYDDQLRANHDGKSSVRRGGGPGKRRMFVGHGWQDVLVVPYFDLPGRICGFLIVGREADPEAGDFIYKRANFGSNREIAREAGVAMLPAISDSLGPDRNFGDTVFVIADPVVGLLLQTQRMRDSTVAFPLVLTYFSQQHQTLRLPPELEGRNLIFWGSHPQLLYQAKMHDGKVSRYRISSAEVERRLNHRHALDWLRLILSDALPWQIAFRRELDKLDLPGVARLVESMRFSPAEMRDVIAGSYEAQRERLIASDPHRIGRNRVLVNGKTIVEIDTGWVVEATGEQICNLALRVEKVATTDSDDCFYVGRASAKEVAYPFTVRKSDVDRRGLFNCVYDHLLNHGRGILNFQSRWSKHSAYIAMQFHEPDYVSRIERIGWQPAQECFQFPKFSIAYGGELNRSSLPVDNLRELPAFHLDHPGYFPLSDVRALSRRNNTTSLIWAVMAGVAHNLLAPALGRALNGLILDGEETASVCRAVSREIGCGIVSLSRKQRGQSDLDCVQSVCLKHGIPYLLECERPNLPMSAEWADDAGIHNAILCLDGYRAAALAAQPGFFRVSSGEPSSPLGEFKELIRYLIPNWLHDVSRRKLAVDRKEEHFVLDVLRDISCWFQRQGGEPTAVLAAKQVLSVDAHSPAASFIRVLDRLYSDGLITATREGFDSPKRKTPVIVYISERSSGEAGVWLPATDINRILAEQKCPAFDLAAVERSIRDEMAWRGEDTYKRVRGWLVDQQWFDDQINIVRGFGAVNKSKVTAWINT